MWDENDSTELSPVSDTGLDAPAHIALGSARAPDDGTPLALMVGYAQQIQRRPAELIATAKQIGELLGKTGFYRFPMGGQDVSGVSIDLAQALAQSWGGIAYQVRILRAEPVSGGGRRLHLRATVTDMKTLVAAEVDQVVSTSAPSQKFAAKADQAERWHSMQAQSAASKIVRNAILRVLPAWYVDAGLEASMAEDARKATGGKALPEARREAVQHFASLGLTEADLVAFVGQPVDLWATGQLSTVRGLAKDLKTGRVSVEQVRADLAAAKAPEDAAPKGKAALGLPPARPAFVPPAADPHRAAQPAPVQAPPAAREPGEDDEPPPDGPKGGRKPEAPAAEPEPTAEQAAFEAHQARTRGSKASAAGEAPKLQVLEGGKAKSPDLVGDAAPGVLRRALERRSQRAAG